MHLLSWLDQKQELGFDELFGLLPAAYGESHEVEHSVPVDSVEWSWSVAVGPAMVHFAGCPDSRTSDHTDLENAKQFYCHFKAYIILDSEVIHSSMNLQFLDGYCCLKKIINNIFTWKKK